MTPAGWEAVAQAVAAAERGGGRVGVAVRGPGGLLFAHRAAERFLAASTVKLAVMVALFRRFDRGESAPGERHTLRAAEKCPGSGVLLALHDGLELTLADLLYLMISISDNTATNLLIRRAGLPAVNATMRELGLTASTLAREMRGRPSAAGEPENWATPADYALLVEAIVTDRAASASACAAMRALLATQQNGRRIARHLPAGVLWGSKTGTVGTAVNDAGFITTTAGTLVLALYCDGFADEPAAEEAIGAISRAAWTAAGLLPAG
jgi:beta-lactamase class A